LKRQMFLSWMNRMYPGCRSFGPLRMNPRKHLKPRPIQSLCRLNCSSIKSLLKEIVREKFDVDPLPGRALFELLIVLYFLSNGITYKVLGHAFGISPSSAHDIVRRWIKPMKAWAYKQIKLPDSISEQEKISEAFQKRSKKKGFRGCVGLLDGVVISIKKPQYDQQSYWCARKHIHGMTTLAMVDHRWRFIYVFIGWPARSHDSMVLMNDPIWKKGYFPPKGNDYWILADCGFPNAVEPIRILTPFKDRGDLTEEQKEYNRTLRSVRSRNEHVFGLLKKVFRILSGESGPLNTWTPKKSTK